MTEEKVGFHDEGQQMRFFEGTRLSILYDKRLVGFEAEQEMDMEG
jgi:hypothetical protein